MEVEISTLRPEEYDDMMRFLERCYRHSRDYFPTRYPHVWRRDTIRWGDRLVARVGGKIVSHVGIFPLTLVVEKARIRVGGIGGVATLQEYRGRGLMTALMNRAIEKMREEGYSMSILWGDRQRYGHFGYETVGRLFKFTLSLRSLEVEGGAREVGFERFYGERELLKRIVELHEAEPLRVVRSERDYELLFSIPQLNTYLSDGEAYVSYMGEGPARVMLEYGGRASEVVSLIYSMLKAFSREFGASSVEVLAPCYPYETFVRLREMCSSWSVVPEGMVKVLDLAKLLEEYSPYLSSACEEVTADVSLEVRRKGEVARLVVDRGHVSVERGGRGRLHLKLTERGLAKLLFDGPEALPIPLPKARVLSSVFPLPLHVWPLDHI
ncbi:MAG: hypothetical protein DRJ56_04015 [Thermoprotei archaeon]|nr:MAG: hypothetical protein DRJ56_04015 [Thermoprotei archaeon]